MMINCSLSVSEALSVCPQIVRQRVLLNTIGAFPLHCTVQYGSLLGGFPLGTVTGTF